MSLARHRSLVKPFDPSSCAAAALGPNTAMSGSAQRIGDPGDQWRFRPDHDQVDAQRCASEVTTAAGSQGSPSTHSAQRAMPGLPGAASSLLAARRLPKPPGERIFAPARAQQQNIHGSPRRYARRPVSERRPRRQFAAAHRQRAFGRAQADHRDSVRRGPRPRRDFGLQAPRVGPLLLHLEGRGRVHRRGDLAQQRRRAGVQARRRRRSHRDRQAHHLSGPLQISDRRRADGAGRRGRACSRCSNGGARRSPPKACSSRSASASCRSCRRDRRRRPRRPARSSATFFTVSPTAVRRV